MKIDISKTYYKHTTGLFITKNTDFNFLKKCLLQAVKSTNTGTVPKLKYTPEQVQTLLDICNKASAFYFSSGNLVFHITGGKVYITKQGIKAITDISTLLKLNVQDIEYDNTCDSMYTITRQSTNTVPVSIDTVISMLK